MASTSIPALDLPIQLFALGTAVGMAIAVVNYHRTGDLELWPVFIAYAALLSLPPASWLRDGERYPERDEASR